MAHQIRLSILMPGMTLILIASPSSWALPNLHVISVEIEEDAARPGDGIHVEWVIKNEGDSNAGRTWHDKLTLIGPDGEPVDTPPISHGYITSLRPGEQVLVRRAMGVPLDASLGQYKVQVDLNHLLDEVETNYLDNRGLSEAFPVTFPNLIVSEVTAEPRPFLDELRYRVTWKVRNAGEVLRVAGTWRDAIYLTSSHPFFEEIEIYRRGYFTVMQPGEEVELTGTVHIPEDIWEGEYCLEVRTDVDQEVPETVEWDNSEKVCEIDLPGIPAPPLPINIKSLIAISILLCMSGILAARGSRTC